MFYYYIYGLHVVFNVPIEMVMRDCSSSAIDVTVEVSYIDVCDIENVDMICVNNDFYRLYIPSIGLYDIQSDKIVCHVLNYNCLISTLFNLPFSVLLLLRGEMLIHACALSFALGVILICGQKGVGKSTLSSALMQSGKFHFFADDTVRIDREDNCFNAHYHMKLYHDVVAALNLNTNGFKNIVGKDYINCIQYADSEKKCNLHSVYILIRGDRLGVKRISSNKHFTQRNIVGIEFMHSCLIKKVLGLNYQFKNLYQLTVPTGIANIMSEQKNIINIIEGI